MATSGGFWGAARRRVKLPFTGLDVWFSSVEANIAEELLKSGKDLADARHLRTIYEEELDEEEITRWKRLIKQLR